MKELLDHEGEPTETQKRYAYHLVNVVSNMKGMGPPENDIALDRDHLIELGTQIQQDPRYHIKEFAHLFPTSPSKQP